MDPKPLVRCVDNEEVALYLRRKRQEMEEKPNGLSENLDMTISTAYRNICNAKTPIKTLKDLSQIKGVGKWILRLMKGFFPETSSDVSPSKEPVQQKGKKTKGPKGPKRYLPQKNSVAYALLITLYRAMANGSDFMKKQELVDAAEASGLSRTSIAPDKSKGKAGQFGSSPRDWYTGWSCMKTLILKGLVVKSSCPAKLYIVFFPFLVFLIRFLLHFVNFFRKAYAIFLGFSTKFYMILLYYNSLKNLEIRCNDFLQELKHNILMNLSCCCS